MIHEIIIPDSQQKEIKKLPHQIRKKLYWCLDMLIKDERYLSLRNKKIEGLDDYWEFSITMNYRGVYRRKDEKVFLVAVGKHEDIF
ncbi:hypothetical protein HZA55_10560 [Candidatus Poribacteria bacterium]|nr:hypothetical protein [Candidatus Poribacteria bacterium]